MSTYEISKSSLLSLRAEILRKQQELTKTKAENEVKIKNLKKTAPLEIKNKGVNDRQKNDISEEEENLLKKSRAALEGKARLYDRLSKQSNPTDDEIEHNRRYLVRFDRKTSKVPDLPPEDSEDDVDRYPDSEEDTTETSHYNSKNPDEEWVEYVDCLGRTRTCLRKDLEYLKSKDKDLKLIVDEKRRNRGERTPPREPTPEPEPLPDVATEDSELLSNDMRRELLRKQWEKEEDELRNKSNIHYQDILFNEARTHGVGYYGFSKDEEERAKQQEALKKLREETQQQQQKAQELKAMREKQLAARVKAAKNRKRARMGLPPEEDVPEPVPEPEKPIEVAKEVDEKEKVLEKMRKNHVRPWDYGKEGVKKEHYEYTQEEWVDKKRKERPAEFAPPSAFRGDISRDKESQRSYRSEKRNEQSGSLRFSSRKPTKADSEADDDIPPWRVSSKTNASKLMERVPIINECESPNSSSDDDSISANSSLNRDDSRGRGAEVAPPPTFDYYGPNDSKKRKLTKPTNNVGDSIEAGLRYLRQQIEHKQSSSRKSEDIFY